MRIAIGLIALVAAMPLVASEMEASLAMPVEMEAESAEFEEVVVVTEEEPAVEPEEIVAIIEPVELPPVQVFRSYELHFVVDQPVRRTLNIEVEMLDDANAVTERHLLQAMACITPLDPHGRMFEVKLERILFEYETFEEYPILTGLDTEASWYSSPTRWWRARELRSGIQEVIVVHVQDEGRPAIKKQEGQAELPAIVQSVVLNLVSGIERIFEGQELEAGCEGFVAAGQVFGKLLGEGLQFAVTDVSTEEVVATVAELGEQLGPFTGKQGSIRWDLSNALICQAESSVDYDVEMTAGEQQIVRCRKSCQITSEVVPAEVEAEDEE